MSNIFEKFAKYSAEKVFKYLGKKSGNMLLTTAIIGFSFSALAQITAIFYNKKYTLSQKAFMVPQEVGEFLVASSALLCVTFPAQKLANKMVTTGKILSKETSQYLKNNGLYKNKGKFDFNIETEIHKIIDSIKNKESYTKLTRKEQENILSEHKSALDTFNTTKDVTSAYATTAAGIATTGVAIPIIRNRFASYYQQVNINAINNSALYNAKFNQNMKV